MAASPTARPAPFFRPFDFLDRGILLAESALSFVIVITMVLVAFLAAAAQLLGIDHPLLVRSVDVQMHGTIWAAFLGASFATRGRKHLAIDVLGRLLKPRGRHALAGVSQVLGSAIAAALAWAIQGSLLERAEQLHEQTELLKQQGLATAVDRSFEFQFIIPVGFALIAVRLLLHGFHEFMAAARRGAEAVSPEAPAEAPSPPRVAPISYASGPVVFVALATLGLVAVVASGSVVAAPLWTLGGLAALTLAVPLFLRWRRTGSLAAPLESPVEVVERFVPAEAAVGAAGVVAVLAFVYFGVENLAAIPIAWGVAFFAVMALTGAPLFTFLGGLACFLWLHGSDTVPATELRVAVEDVLGEHFARMSVLPTIPIFTFAGYLMSESNTPARLVRVARAWLGWFPGGMAVVCVLASAFFTVFSGASGITIVAIGGLLLPALLKNGYPEKFSLGLVTTGGALGITFFPCLPLIVYGIVAGLQETPPGVEKLQLDKLILAGIMPGLLIIGLLVLYSMVFGITHKLPRSSFDRKEAFSALWEAKWELLLPFIIAPAFARFGPVPAAALTALYVLVFEVFFTKDLSLTRDLPRVAPDSMVLVGAIFVKLCAATVLTFYFVDAQVADRIFETLTCGPEAQAYLAAHSDAIGTCREAVDALAREGKSAGGLIDSSLTFLLALNVFLLVVGMLMDIFSAIVVIVPLIMGIALHFNINPYHLGVVFLINLEIGYLMPPMGLNLFIAGFRFNRPVPDLYRVVLPFIGIFGTALLITTYVPSLTLALLPESKPAAVAPVTGVGDAAPGEAPALGGTADDCAEPRPDESFDDFSKRCDFGE